MIYITLAKLFIHKISSTFGQQLKPKMRAHLNGAQALMASSQYFFSKSRDCLLTYFQYWSSVLLIVIKLKLLVFGGIEPEIYLITM